MVIDEIWKPILIMPGFEASSLGRIRRGDKVIKLSVHTSTGYLRTTHVVDGKRIEVLAHRAVASAFHGPCPDGWTVNHIDGTRTGNAPDNLEYLTRSDNLRDMWEKGRGPRGDRHGRHTMPEASARGTRIASSKLNPEKIRAIRKYRSQGASYSTIVDRFDISKSQVCNIITGKHWGHVK